MRCTVVLVADTDRGLFVAHVPAVPDCVTQGATVEEALAMAADLAAIQLADLLEAGEELPVEPFGTVVSAIEVPVPAPVAAA